MLPSVDPEKVSYVLKRVQPIANKFLKGYDEYIVEEVPDAGQPAILAFGFYFATVALQSGS